MFSDNKKKGQQNLSSQQNKIAEGTRIIGDIISEGGFRIDGVIEGNVKTSSKVVIGKKGSIKGTLNCANADIEGKVTGKVAVQGTLSLKSTAVIQGEVMINKLAVEPGATFNATCTMGGAVKSLSSDLSELNSISEKVKAEQTA
ncbi:MAG: polymer-forming cytoskeletal protein [Flavobacteriaceae bacterium]|nr:polymer-forming cytoskeletal protein [Flavobacteriaceae bacterium]